MRIGVLALQGGFAEHVSHLRKAAANEGKEDLVEVVEARTAEELECCHALVIPGGESTCMAHICEQNKLLDPLRAFCATHPVWGTCAGMIFLAKSIQDGQKKGGQSLIGNMDISVNRNFFGNQVHSFETSMKIPEKYMSGNDLFRAVFIRAPAILMDKESSPEGVEYLSVLELDAPVKLDETRTVDKVAVAAKQNHILVTAFHPELTSDSRWHALFVQMAAEHCEKGGKGMQDKKAFPKTPLPLVEIPYLPALC